MIKRLKRSCQHLFLIRKCVRQYLKTFSLYNFQFKVALSLFLEKYCAHTDFIEYFREEWIVQSPNWFEGNEFPAPKMPSKPLIELSRTRLRTATAYHYQNILKFWKMLSVNTPGGALLTLCFQKTQRLKRKCGHRHITGSKLKAALRQNLRRKGKWSCR